MTDDWFKDLEKLSDNTATVVHRIGSHYRDTDQDSAAKLDSALNDYSYGNIGGTPQDYPVREPIVSGENNHGPLSHLTLPALFHDLEHPPDHLDSVGDYSGMFQHQASILDALSPATAIRNAIIAVTQILADLGQLDSHIDPMEKVIKKFSGDWAGFRACADVFWNLADACSAASKNVKLYQQSTYEVWQGNASDACITHLGDTRDCLGKAAGEFRELGWEYSDTATAAAEAAELVNHLVTDLADAAIIAVAALGAGGASSWTVVGGLVGGGVAAYELNQIRKLMVRIDEVITNLENLLHGSRLMFHGGQLNISGFHLPPLTQTGVRSGTMDDLRKVYT